MQGITLDPAVVTLRWLAGVALWLSLIAGSQPCLASDTWGGSVDVTSDYLVRGISRSDGDPALQLELHYLNSNGFVAGLFASNTRIDPDLPTDVELNAFLGFAWSSGDDWHGRVLAAHYAYPWNRLGSGYDYDELDVDAGFQDWLRVGAVVSPNAPRYLPYRGLIGVTSESIEVNLQRPVLHRLSATAGVGYSHYGGDDAAGYVYWSVGAAYDLAPVSLVLSYVNTTAGAKALFYNGAADGRVIGTIIFRF
jgi:uncharacterized protein (TIGR02001 family)